MISYSLKWCVYLQGWKLMFFLWEKRPISLITVIHKIYSLLLLVSTWPRVISVRSWHRSFSFDFSACTSVVVKHSFFLLILLIYISDLFWIKNIYFLKPYAKRPKNIILMPCSIFSNNLQSLAMFDNQICLLFRQIKLVL